MQEIKNEKSVIQDNETTQQVSITGFTSINGNIEEPYAEYTPEEKIELYFKMRRDPIIQTSLELIKNPIITSKRTFKERKILTDNTKRMIEYLEWTWQNIYNGYYSFKRHWAMKFDFGLALFEPVFNTSAKYQGISTWQLAKMSPIMLRTINKYHYDDFGNFIGIKQMWQKTSTGQMNDVDIWLSKLWYDNNNEEFGNILGTSVIESIIPYYLMKKSILGDDVRTRQRGLGVPAGSIDIAYDEKLGRAFERDLNTIGNSKGAYFKTLFRVDGNGNKIPITEIDFKNIDVANTNFEAVKYYDQACFYNTQTHFALSGVQDVGSRAAAESQKSPFIARVNQELRLEDERFNDLNDLILAYSLYGNINKDEWPIQESEQIGTETVEAVKERVVGAAKELSLDVNKRIIEACYGKHTITLSDNKAVDGYRDYVYNKKSSPELKKVFSLKLSADTYDSIYSRASNLILDVYNTAISQKASELEKNPKADLKLGRFGEAESKLKRLADEAFDKGIDSINEEDANLSGLKMAADPTKPIISFSINDEIHDKLQNLWTNTASAIEQFLKTHNQQSLDQGGGIKKSIEDNFLDQRVNDRNDICSTIAGAFTAGRSTQILKKDKPDDLYECTSILDKNLCEECGKYDGQRGTLAEFKAIGFNISPNATSLNPNCLGKKGANECRCQLVKVGKS